MDAQTRAHLDRAERNRDLARALFHTPLVLRVGLPPSEWVAVIAFYAAVHYVNAHEWERQGQGFGGHGPRARWVARQMDIRSAQPSYALLADRAWHARYTLAFSLSRADAADLLNTDLAAVETAVVAALASTP